MRLIENYLNEMYNNSRIFHISDKDLNGKILKPRIPSNTFTDRGYENKTIPRISFSLTIDHCLLALGKNVKGITFNVYEPDDYSKIKIVSNKEIVKKKYIPDAQYTKEVWVTSKCKMKYVGQIKVTKASDDYEQFDLGKGSMEGYTVKLYYWDYKIIEGNLK